MKKYRVSDVADEISIRVDNPSSKGYDKFVGLEHYVSGEMVISNYDSTNSIVSSVKEFKNGDILIARRNVYLKRAGIVFFDGVTSGDSIVLRPKTKIISKLLPFMLNSDKFWDYADKHADGSMSKRLSPKSLLQYEFDLPDEDKQEEYANLLWSIFDLLIEYKNYLIKSDDLIKAKFIKLFDTGNHIKLKEIANISSGQSSPKDVDFSDYGTPFIKAGNLEDLKLSNISEQDCNLVNNDIVKKYKLKLHKSGTVLVAKSGMSCLSGHIYSLKNDAYVVSHLACIEPIDIKYSNYIKGYFLTYGIEYLIKDLSYPSIQLATFENIDIPFSSEECINEYSSFVDDVFESKEKIRNSMIALDKLLKSLIGKVF